MIPAADPEPAPARGRGEVRAALVGEVEQAETRGVTGNQPGSCGADGKAEQQREGGDHEALRWAITSRAAVANVFFVRNPSSRSILFAL